MTHADSFRWLCKVHTSWLFRNTKTKPTFCRLSITKWDYHEIISFRTRKCKNPSQFSFKNSRLQFPEAWLGFLFPLQVRHKDFQSLFWKLIYPAFSWHQRRIASLLFLQSLVLLGAFKNTEGTLTPLDALMLMVPTNCETGEFALSWCQTARN